MSVKSYTVRIGTRGSKLALFQAEMVRAALAMAAPHVSTETVIIKTSGDWRPEQGEALLPERQGGKALFAREIEEALLRGEIDAGVHSMKDMETVLPPGLAIHCMLPREDARDVLLLHDRQSPVQNLAELPLNIRLGTASPRRSAFLRARRPDIEIAPLRGNVETRIRKLREGQVGATLLALAGLKRLGLEHEADLILDPGEMLPAAGQGAVGVEIRSGDAAAESVFNSINCPRTLLCVSAERAVLEALGGSCRTAIGAYAVFQEYPEGHSMYLRASTVSGREIISESESRPVMDRDTALAFGLALGKRLKQGLPPGFFS